MQLTTASTAVPVPFRDNRMLQGMCLVMAAVILITGLNPEKVFDWWLENLLAMTFLAILAASYSRLVLSQTSYLLILVFICMHEWGAQYKYSDVPLGEWMKAWSSFGTAMAAAAPAKLEAARNHYDRVMHFGYGLLMSYPIQEWFMRSARVWSRWNYFFTLQMVLACSAVYEIMEAGMAGILSPERGEEFVGMQGDIWDAQKDMLMAALGSVVALGIIAIVRQRRATVRALDTISNAEPLVKATYAGQGR